MQAIPENPATLFARTEATVVAAVQWLKLGVELVGATIIALEHEDNHLESAVV